MFTGVCYGISHIHKNAIHMFGSSIEKKAKLNYIFLYLELNEQILLF